jgi:NADH:quinone reductase (non-electrogenic)
VAELPHVVIVGGGFGGLYAAKELGRAPVRVTLVDRRNHHVFQPLLYQVATAALNPSDIASPIRAVLRRQANTTVLLAEVSAIDLAGRRVVLRDGELRYDWLILATGATHSYFGHDEWSTLAPGLKTIEDALEIRRRVLFAFEAAEREDDPAARKAWLTFAVVGAGATGVEVAGALAEIARHTVARDFRRVDTRATRVVLLEGGPRVLPAYPEDLSAKAEKQLRKLGVEVYTNTQVTGIDGSGVALRAGERIDARTTLWAAGVTASPLGRTLGVECDRAGRVKVTPRLTVPGHDEVFVVGDLAALEENGKLIPGVAGAAVQGGRHAARQIERSLIGEPIEAFRYVDKGSLATIGRKAAVADFGRVKLSGFLAWAAWLFIHILLLIGFRNRVLVFIEWAWAYFTYQRGARLITGPPMVVANAHPSAHTEACAPPVERAKP